MPVPIPARSAPPLFPSLTRANVNAALTSAWLDTFEDLTAPTAIISIDELGEREAFLQWMGSESIFMPEGAGHTHPSDEDAPTFKLPKLNDAIRAVIDKHGPVFPKLNWTAPRDAAFLLPQGDGPLHCTSPADVYLLIKSSDFAHHGIATATAYEGTSDEAGPAPPLELVLKKHEDINPSQEVRCFIRDDILLGISQRDTNFYDHLQDAGARQKLTETVRAFFEDEVRDNYEGRPDYVLDLYVQGENVQVVDFGPYREQTDSLLFTYEELRDIFETAGAPPPSDEGKIEEGEADTGAGAEGRPRLPILRVIDHAAHPAANRNAPTYQTNMVPVEMVDMSQGRTADEFREAWNEAIAAGFADASEEMPQM